MSKERRETRAVKPTHAVVLSLLCLALAHLLAGCSMASERAQYPTPANELAARADALLAEQGSLLVEGHTDEVLSGVEETIALYDQLDDPYGQAAAVVMRGLARWGVGGGKATAADLEKGLALLEEAEDPLGSWLVLWLLGEGERQEGRFGSAEVHLRRGLDLLAEVKASPGPLDFRGFEKLGRVCGAPVEMLQAMGPASAFLKPMLVGLLEIPLRDTLVGVLIELERLEEAQTELEQASAGAALFGGLFDSGLHIRRGDLRRRQWRLEEARESYEKALASPSLIPLVPSAGGDVVAWKVLDRLAEVESLLGRIAEALHWNDKALQRAREADNASRQAMVLQDRAGLYADRGEFEEAGRFLLEAERIAHQAGDGYRLATILGDRGQYALTQGRYEEAASYLERSAARLIELDEPYVAAPTLLLLVEAYQILEAHDRTDALLERASELADLSGFHDARSLAEALSTWNLFVQGRTNRGEVRRSLEELLESAGSLMGGQWMGPLLLGLEGVTAGELDEGEAVARELLSTETSPLGKAFAQLTLGIALLRREDPAAEGELKRAVQALHRLGQRDLEGMAQGALSALQWRDGRREQATDSLEEAVNAFETVIGAVQVEELLASFLGGGRGSLYGLLVDMLAAAERPRDAFLQAERSRARAFLRLLGNQRLRPLAGSDPHLVERANALRIQIGEWERALFTAPSEARRKLENDLHHARRDYEDLLVRIKVQNPEYASLASVEPASPEAIQEALDPGVTLISYFLTRAGAYAWIIERDRFEMVSLPVESADLLEVACWAREVGRARNVGADGSSTGERGVTVFRGCDPAEDRAERLYEKLFAPLLASPLGRKLVIVPHGPLHYLPVAALRDPETGRFLIEDHELTLAPSASVLPFLQDKETPVEGRALVLGAPWVEDPRLPALPGARAEAREVAALLGVEPRLDLEATEGRIHESAGGIDLLHVAAHGLYHPEAPRFSRIVLAEGDGHDGNLEVHEVFGGLDLSGVNLVVLSACQTAAGPNAGGDEIVSLTRAFLYAGSPGVLSTLWPVSDQPSAELMKRFYRRLLGGARASAALREAQLEMLREGPRDPYFWAGYTLTGDPRGRWGGSHSSRSTSSPNRDSP